MVVQVGDLADEIAYPLFELVEMLQQTELLLSGGFDQTAFTTMGNQGGTVEVQPLNVKGARRGQGEQVAIFPFGNMVSIARSRKASRSSGCINAHSRPRRKHANRRSRR